MKHLVFLLFFSSGLIGSLNADTVDEGSAQDVCEKTYSAPDSGERDGHFDERCRKCRKPKVV